MEAKNLIQEFFNKNMKKASVANRYLLLFDLFMDLKSHSIIRKGMNEECGRLLMSLLTPKHLIGAAKLNFEMFLFCDIDKYMGLIFDSESGFEKKKKKPKPKEIKKETKTKDKDIIKTEKSEQISISRSEIKDKEFDMEVLKELGINVEDLKNE